MKLLLNFASRSRPYKFHACMQNIRKAFEEIHYEVLLKIDRDDKTIRQYLDRHYPELILDLAYSDSKIHAINRGVPKSGWDILVNTSDDINWKNGAGREIIKHMEKDTFLHFPEVYAEDQARRHKKQSTCVVSIMDNTYYNRFGFVYNPLYKSIWCDTEATEIAKKLGRYKFVDRYIFEHLHPAAGKAVKDAQYKKTESFNSEDKQTYLKRKKEGFGL